MSTELTLFSYTCTIYSTQIIAVLLIFHKGNRKHMGNTAFDPRDFGVSMDKDDFFDQMVNEFSAAFRDSLTIDELLLHPSEALRFVQDVRTKLGNNDVPEDAILRPIMTRRKNPGG